MIRVWAVILMHEPCQIWLPVLFPGRSNWSGAVLQAPLQLRLAHIPLCNDWAENCLCLGCCYWANIAGFVFSSLFSSWLLWSEEDQCQHRLWAQLCLIWHEAVPAASSQLRADLVDSRRRWEREGVKDALTFESTGCA